MPASPAVTEKLPPGFMIARIETIVVRHDVVEDLTVVVNGHDVGLSMNRVGDKDVMLEYTVRNRPASAAEFGRGEQLRPEDVIPLLTDIERVRGDGDAARCNGCAAGALEMACGQLPVP